MLSSGVLVKTEALEGTVELGLLLLFTLVNPSLRRRFNSQTPCPPFIFLSRQSTYSESSTPNLSSTLPTQATQLPTRRLRDARLVIISYTPLTKGQVVRILRYTGRHESAINGWYTISVQLLICSISQLLRPQRF